MLERLQTRLGELYEQRDKLQSRYARLCMLHQYRSADMIYVALKDIDARIETLESRLDPSQDR